MDVSAVYSYGSYIYVKEVSADGSYTILYVGPIQLVPAYLQPTAK